jgi:hypothetical protein
MSSSARAVVLSFPTSLPTAGTYFNAPKWETIMDTESVGEIVATRNLYYLDDANQKRTVTVFIGKPQPANGSLEYECPFQVIGIGNQQAKMARGHDSIQALQSALILAAANVNHLNDKLGRKLVWEGGVKGELGFP